MADKTLYDVLRVRPNDDPETLHKAFRDAVKGSHPDLNADDPDAPGRFRQVVTAYAVLRDDEQRGAYNRQLAVVRSRRRWKLTRLVVDVVMVAVFTAVMVGGYVLYAEVSKTSVPATKVVEVAAPGPAAGTAVPSTTETRTANRDEPSARPVEVPVEVPATVPVPGAVPSEVNGAPPAIADASPTSRDEPSAKPAEVPAAVPVPSAVASEANSGGVPAMADARPANQDEPSTRPTEVPATVPPPSAIPSEENSRGLPAMAEARPADIDVDERAAPTDTRDRTESDGKLERAELTDGPAVPRAVARTTSKMRVHATHPPANRRAVRRVALESGNTSQVALEKRRASACAGSCSDPPPPLFGIGF